jgi:hypothetical protein
VYNGTVTMLTFAQLVKLAHTIVDDRRIFIGDFIGNQIELEKDARQSTMTLFNLHVARDCNRE